MTKPNVNAARFADVEAIDFAEFVETLNSSIVLVKMDIEGAEGKVLARLIDSGIVKKIRHLLVEAHDWRLPEIALEMKRVRRLIREQGFSNVDLDWK